MAINGLKKPFITNYTRLSQVEKQTPLKPNPDKPELNIDD